METIQTFNNDKIIEDVLTEKYCLKGETNKEEIFLRVAKGVASAEKTKKLRDIWNKKFLNNMRDGAVGGGRIMASAGTDIEATLINCFVQPVGDYISKEEAKTELELNNVGIYDAVNEAARTMRRGGGVGYDFSHVRPRDSYVKTTNSRSSGPCSFIDVFDASCKAVESAASRRGAQLGALRIDHPDIEEFILAKRTPGRWNNFNVSVSVTEKFMQALMNNENWDLIHIAKPHPEVIKQKNLKQNSDGLWIYKTMPAKELWDKIMKSNYEYAEPGILFIDRINEYNNLYYCETIEATNPCVTGDTLILTDKGYVRIDSVVDKEITIWNGFEWSVVTPKVTGTDQEIYDLEFSDGSMLSCTPYHKHILPMGGRVETKDLLVGCAFSSYNLKVIEGSKEIDSNTAYMQGYNITDDINVNTEHLIPSAEYTVKSRLSWLSGLIYKYATIGNDSIIIGNLGRKFLFNVKLMLNTLGVNSTLIKELDNSNNSEYKLVISNNEVVYLLKLGINLKSDKLNFKFKYKDNSFITLVSKQLRTTRESKVYCFNDSKNNSGIFNGILTANCGEQPLPNYGCCDLGPIDLSRFVTNPFTPKAEFNYSKLSIVTEIQVRFLDNVLDATMWPLEKQKTEAMNKRRIGIGITGLGNVIAMMNYRYGDKNSVMLTSEIMRHMRDCAYTTSALLAKEKGPFPLFDKDKYLSGKFVQSLPKNILDLISSHGIRNSHLLSIAPTGCVVPDTLIMTDHGLVRIGILNKNIKQWQDTFLVEDYGLLKINTQWKDINIEVSTDSGYKKADKFYNNGVRPVLTVIDNHGSKITATENHRLRVINNKGDYIWKRFDEIVENDVLVKVINNYPNTSKPMVSNNVLNIDANTEYSEFNKNIELTPDIAELIGYICNSEIVGSTIRIYHYTNKYTEVFKKLSSTLINAFNIKEKDIVIKNNGYDTIHTMDINSIYFLSWLSVNGSIQKDQDNLHMPAWILLGGRDIICAFIRGLFSNNKHSADNGISYICKNNIIRDINCALIRKLHNKEHSLEYADTYTYTNNTFIDDLQYLLASIGILSTIDIIEHKLSINDFVSKTIFRDKIGFMNDKDYDLSSDETINKDRTNDLVIANHGSIEAFKLKNNITEEIVFSNVKFILDGWQMNTVDISVPDNVTYIANGFVSHNTTSIAFGNNCSGGIEPPFSLAYTRKKRNASGDGFTMYNVFDNGFLTFINNNPKDYNDDLVKAVANGKKVFNHNGKEYVVKDILPSTLVTALELKVDEHMAVMTEAQKYVDSSISKTINVPKEINYDDFKHIYLKAYTVNLKGISTYRPNDVLGSVLTAPTETKEPEPTKDVNDTLETMTEEEKNIIENITLNDSGDIFKVFATSPIAEKNMMDMIKNLEQSSENNLTQSDNSNIDIQSSENQYKNFMLECITHREIGVLKGISLKEYYSGYSGKCQFYITMNYLEKSFIYNNKQILIKRPLEIFLNVKDDSLNSTILDGLATSLSLLARSNFHMFIKALENLNSLTSDKGKVRHDFIIKENGEQAPRFHNSELACISYAIQKLLLNENIIDVNGKLLTLKDLSLITPTVINSVNRTDNKTLVITNNTSAKTCINCNANSVIKKDGCSYCTNCGQIGDCG